VIHLVRTFLDGTTALGDDYRYTGRKRDRQVLEQDLVACHFAVRQSPVPGGWLYPTDITVHPDIPFALRLTDRPAPAEPDRAHWRRPPQPRQMLARRQPSSAPTPG
jgi:hypothetical protein